MSSYNNPVRRIASTASDLAVLNAETTGKVLLRQTEAFESAVKATVDQFKTVLGAESFGDAVEAQRSYVKNLTDNARDAGRDSWETIRDAGRQAGDVVRGTFRTDASDVSDSAEQTFETVQEAAQNTVEEVRNDVSDFVAPEAH